MEDRSKEVGENADYRRLIRDIKDLKKKLAEAESTINLVEQQINACTEPLSRTGNGALPDPFRCQQLGPP